jgi:hypothetical protein
MLATQQRIQNHLIDIIIHAAAVAIDNYHGLYTKAGRELHTPTMVAAAIRNQTLSDDSARLIRRIALQEIAVA